MTGYPYPDAFSKQNIQIKSSDGSAAEINPYGAHVLSWQTADQRERLFLSPKAEFRSGYPIRGGIPLVFPQFSGLGPLLKHGFARIQSWKMTQVTVDSVTFQLARGDFSTADGMNVSSWPEWPYRFLAEYHVKVENKCLSMTLSINNTDIAPFSFTAALHTYLQVTDSEKSAVRGLQGLDYRDSTASGKELREGLDELTFQGEIDRIYLDVPTQVILADGSEKLIIDSVGFPDVVVWNPGALKCAALPDLQPESYKKFVCIEAAVIAKPVHLLPGSTWQGRQILTI